MRIVITGARGFIGRNLQVRLAELGGHEVRSVEHDSDADALPSALAGADFVFHLAGVNRPVDAADFARGNVDFTHRLCEALAAQAVPPRVVYASSTQATLDNPYGKSKRRAEEVLLDYARRCETRVYLFRLTNVFGKWSRPDYNSAVATFCHRIARGEPVVIHDATAPLRLIHVDDVVRHFCGMLDDTVTPTGFVESGPEYETTVGDVVAQIGRFRSSRTSLVCERVGSGLTRALYATYVSFLPPEAFAYTVPRYADARGVFVEMLKTHDSGQFGYFTAHPGVTRGEHYHHTKTEKFLVIQGRARFASRHLLTGEQHEVMACGGDGQIVETIPGWTHNVANIGDDMLIVLVWANEVFDRQRPDTVANPVKAEA